MSLGFGWLSRTEVPAKGGLRTLSLNLIAKITVISGSTRYVNACDCMVQRRSTITAIHYLPKCGHLFCTFGIFENQWVRMRKNGSKRSETVFHWRRSNVLCEEELRGMSLDTRNCFVHVLIFRSCSSVGSHVASSLGWARAPSRQRYYKDFVPLGNGGIFIIPWWEAPRIVLLKQSSVRQPGCIPTKVGGAAKKPQCINLRM